MPVLGEPQTRKETGGHHRDNDRRVKDVWSRALDHNQDDTPTTKPPRRVAPDPSDRGLAHHAPAPAQREACRRAPPRLPCILGERQRSNEMV